MHNYDVIIIGAGTAGLSAAKVLKKEGASYLLVEQGEGGTLCAKAGCMPSKALIEVANTYHERKKFPGFGIRGYRHVYSDIRQVLAHVRKMRDSFVNGVLEGMKDHPVIHGKARFLSPDTIEVNGETYRADKILICTGSTPHIPEPFKPYKDDILTTDNLFEQETLPESLAVIGLGSVGMEMGQALARLDIEVFGLDPGETLAGIHDPAVNETAQDIMSREIRLYQGYEITEVSQHDDHSFRIITDRHKVETSAVLVCAGRRPYLDGLDLEALDLECDDNGVPLYDSETLKIENHDIYIAGDVNADRAILHEAADEGEIAARHALGLNSVPGRSEKMEIVFTDPAIIRVGQSFDEIEEQGAQIGEVSYDDQGRARLMGKNKGTARIYAEKETDRIIGAEMMAPAAEHMAHLLALAANQNMSAQDMLDMPIYHPVLEEGLRKALATVTRNA